MAANAELLDDITSEVAYLESLTSRLLILARADAGKLRLNPAPLDLAGFVTSLTRELQPLARSAGVELSCNAPASIVVEADAARLQEALLALLDNAIRHTPAAGSVRLDLTRDGPWACLSIADSGGGIPAAELERVYERFYQVDPARSTGSGLGLPIARTLVEAHRGALTISSSASGTVAVIRLASQA